MQATCLQENLNAALGLLGRGFYSGARSRGYSQLLAVADQQRLTLTATNSDTFLEATVPAIVEAPGRLSLPGRLLTDFIASLDDEKLDWATDPDRPHVLQLQCGPRTKATLLGSDPEKFPPFPELEPQLQAVIAPEELRKALRRTLFSAAKEDARPVLNTLSLTFNSAGLTAASADGFRLSEQKVPLDEAPAEEFTLLVPLADLEEVERLLGRQDLPVTITVAASMKRANFQFASSRLSCSLMQGNFPNYQSLIPQDWVTKAVFPRPQMQQHVNFAAAVSERDGAHIVRLNMTRAEGEQESSLRIRSNADDYGNADGTLGAEIHGVSSRIAFNAKYLQDILTKLDVPEIALCVSSESNPGVFRPTDPAEEFVHVTMPMFVQWEEPAPAQEPAAAEPETPESEEPPAPSAAAGYASAAETGQEDEDDFLNSPGAAEEESPELED